MNFQKKTKRRICKQKPIPTKNNAIAVRKYNNPKEVWMTNKKYTKKEIVRIQKELCELGIVEEFTDYRISEKFLDEFLINLEKHYGKKDYFVGSQIIPLADRLRAKYPEASEEDIIRKAHKLIPVIRAMFEDEKILKLVKKAMK